MTIAKSINKLLRLHKTLAILVIFSAFTEVNATEITKNSHYPDGLFLTALTNKGWQFFVTRDQNLQAIDAIEHPRGGSYQPALNRIAYLGSDNIFYEHDLGTGSTTTLSRSEETSSRYTQPRYSQSGEYLLAVELPDGRSRRTQIIGINTETYTHHRTVSKRTAQFEPQMMSDNFLYYTTAICVDDCEGMIWELWQRDMRTSRQQQLTLMNAVAKQPHPGYDDWLYFSSNANGGHYNIWRMQPEAGSKPQQLTFGTERDSSPATDRDGNLYFLRKTQSGTDIIKLSNGQFSRITLPESIKDVRHLEVVQ